MSITSSTLTDLAETLSAGSGSGADTVASWGKTEFETTQARWLPTGVRVTDGQAFTVFTEGNLDVGLGVPLEPRHLYWYRIGAAGSPRNLASNFETLTAQGSGELYLTIRPFGFYWDNPTGSYPAEVAAAEGLPTNLAAVTVAWKDDPEQAIEQLSSPGNLSSAAASAARSDLQSKKQLPEGFDHLHILGRSNTFSQWRGDERHGIHAQTSDEVGIVKVPLDIPLTDSTSIEFDWRYLSLPALGPETEVGFHDYVSLAVEFDNGQDITWFWSANLEAGLSFRCPLPWWDTRETHIVLQSGTPELGKWFSHQRPVKADYLNAVGGKAPERIVGVWFIINSVFGRQQAEAYFSDVVIRDGDESIAIFK